MVVNENSLFIGDLSCEHTECQAAASDLICRPFNSSGAKNTTARMHVWSVITARVFVRSTYIVYSFSVSGL